MKVVVAALIALCSVSAIPFIPGIPGDNSHYIEGQSRYIWMLDDEGAPTLVDLEAPILNTFQTGRSGEDNVYWLFTRDNPTDAQLLVNGNASTITSSNYNASKPTTVISHGWNNNGNSTVNTLITAAVLGVQDANVIVLDWSSLASANYISATAGVPEVGEYLGNFLIWLIEITEGDWDTFHLVGHSLGAHVVANAGRTANGSPKRVTGCDPAGPLWTANTNAMTTGDGQLVEAIHTDGGILGLLQAIADIDFFPNGGTNPQPGCLLSTCSHSRSYELFAASVTYDHLVGYNCTNILEAHLNACSGPGTLNLGNGDLDKSGVGIFALTTDSEYPY